MLVAHTDDTKHRDAFLQINMCNNEKSCTRLIDFNHWWDSQRSSLQGQLFSMGKLEKKEDILDWEWGLVIWRKGPGYLDRPDIVCIMKQQDQGLHC